MLPSSARFHGFRCRIRRSQRLPVITVEYLMMAFIALTIVACLRMVGIVLVISLLTIPQVTANIFTHSFKAYGIALHRDRLQRLSGRPLPVVPLQYTVGRLHHFRLHTHLFGVQRNFMVDYSMEKAIKYMFFSYLTV